MIRGFEASRFALSLGVAEGLVSVRPLVGVGHGVLASVSSGSWVGGGLLVAVGDLAGTERLVGVGGLFGGDAASVVVAVAIWRATGAAANAEGPEDQSAEREGNGQPGSDVDVLTHRQADSVGLESCAQGGLEDGEEDGRGDRSGSGEEEGEESEESGHTATPATADSEETDHNLDDGDNEGDQVGDKHPLGDSLVDVHDLVVLAGKLILDIRGVQAPDGEGVEVELALGLGALRNVRLLVVDVAIAISPETDLVEVGECAVLLKLGEDIGDILSADIGNSVLFK
jgi:hypothetical protein